MAKTKLTLEQRVALHRRMAESYGNAYIAKRVGEGATYLESGQQEAWKFADDVVYSSPYWTQDKAHPFSKFPMPVHDYATIEARAYTVNVPDWGAVDFKCWPADNGFVMKLRWEGHKKKDGKKIGFYSYSFVETNEYGEVTRWETHVNKEYDDFLDVAIGEHGPYADHRPYIETLRRVCREGGLSDVA